MDAADNVLQHNRNRVELQNMFGFFANLATLRFHCPSGGSFRDLLRSVAARFGDTQAHCDIPYEQLREELQKGCVNVPEIRIIVGAIEAQDLGRFGRLDLRYDAKRTTMRWGCTFNFSQDPSEEQIRIGFDAHIFDPARVRALCEQLARLLDGADSIQTEVTAPTIWS